VSAMWLKTRTWWKQNVRRLVRQPASNAVYSTYADHYAAVFDKPPDPSAGWIHFPFAWPTPEAQELQAVIWKIENRVWKQFLETVHRQNTAGDLVEFGVSVGNSLDFLVNCCEEIGLNIPIYGFDSFEGLPEPTAHDMPYWHKGEFAADFDAVSRRLKTDLRPQVKLVKGWFCDTLAQPEIRNAIRTVAFARIDCDLYEPACECLAFLESRLADGAYLCFDDWTDDPQTGETRAFFKFADRTRTRFTFEPVCRISLGGMHLRVYHK
jgi:hypothetical protein